MRLFFLVLLVVVLLGAGWFVLAGPPAGVDQALSSVPTGTIQPSSTELPVEPKPPITMLFGGDLMFDRYIRTVAVRRGNSAVFSDDLRTLLAGQDLAVANLEGPITDQPSVSVASEMGEWNNYRFTFHPSWAETLRELRIGVVGLGNNHILNFGQEGLAQTRQYLEQAGIGYFGAPDDERYLLRQAGGYRVALVGYNQFGTRKQQATLGNIGKAREDAADLVVVFAHWGEEYEPVTEYQRTLAHAFIDAGADLVVGAHPHIVQEHEEYRGKRIYYSLGNFVFDQYFRPETKAGMLVQMTFDGERLEFREIPLSLGTNGQTGLQ